MQRSVEKVADMKALLAVPNRIGEPPYFKSSLISALTQSQLLL